MSNTSPAQYQVWRENASGDEHNVTSSENGEVTTWCDSASRHSWLGPVNEFLSQFTFLRSIPQLWRNGGKKS